MKGSFRSLLARTGLLVLALALAGCSAEARKARRLEKANAFLAAGDYDSAEIEYLNALRVDGNSPEAISRLGILYFDQGRMGKMVPFLMRGRELQPENLELRLRLGKCFLAMGRFDDARNEALYVLQRQPQMEDAPILLAGAALRPPEVEEARRQLQALPPALLESAPVLVALGTLDLRQGKTKEAEATFKRAEAADPKSGAAQSAVGALYWSQNNLEGADRAFALAAEQAPARSTRRLQRAQFKLRTNKLDEARTLFNEMLKQAPDYLPAMLGLAEIASLEKKYDEAIATLGKILARDAAHPDAMLMTGRTLLAKGEPARAVLEAEKVLHSYPQSAPGHYLLGSALVATGEIDKAIVSFRQATTVAPGYIDAALALASLNIRKGDFTSALAPLRAIVQQRPDLTPARLLLADAYRGLGNLNEALAIYRQLRAADPKVPETAMLMGMVLLQQNQRAQAREAFNQALEASPNFIPAHEQLVDLDLRENKAAAALERIEALALRSPTAGGPHLLKAKIFLLQREAAKAEAARAEAAKDVPKATASKADVALLATKSETALLKAIELEPDAPPPYFVLARLYVETGETAKALARLQSVLDKNPKDAAALMLVGVLNDQQKNHAAARQAYENLLVTNPNSVAALNNLAYLYSEHFNELDKAQALAQKARDLLPQEAHTADTLGWILYKKRQYTQAAALIQESAGKPPTSQSAAVQYHLGMARYMLGQEQAARAALETALGLESNFDGAEEARQSLAVLTLDESQAANARTLLEKAVAARPDDTVALTRLGAVYEQARAHDKAADAYEKALKASPGNLKASLSLIRLHAARGQTAKALELARAAQRSAPEDAAVAHALGRLAYQTGDSAWAASLLQESARKQPDQPEVWYDLGLASYNSGRIGDAESAVRRALELSPAFPHAAAARAFLELLPASTGADASPAAAARVEQALKADPASAPGLMALGRLQEQKKDTAAARQTYEKLLGHHPDFSPARRQLAILYAADPQAGDKAYEFAMKARESFPDDAELAKVYGIALYRKKDYTRAADILRSTSARRAEDAELLYYLGMTRRELKDAAGARQALQAALNLDVRADLATEARRVLAELK